MGLKKTIERPIKIGIAALITMFAFWRLPSIINAMGRNMPMAQTLWGILFFAASMRLLLWAFFHQSSTPPQKKYLSYCLGFIFTAFLLIGRQMDRTGTFLPLSRSGVLGLLFSLLLYTLWLGSFVLFLVDKIINTANKLQQQNLGKESHFSRLAGNGWLIFAVLFTAWIPVWFALWPGIFRADASWQFYSFIYQDWQTHHPLLHTIFHGGCLALGLKMGSMTAAVAFYTCIQMALMAGILAYSCHWLWRRNVPLSIRLGIIALFAFFPVYPIWSISATKDILFGGLMLLFLLQVIDWWEADGATLYSPRKITRFILTGIIMLLLRHNGIHILLVSTPFFMLLAQKAWRIRIGAMCGAIIAIYLLCDWGMTQALQAQRGDEIEMMSIPLQQLARVALVSPETLSETEMTSIQNIYGDRNIADIYIPASADNNKWAANSGLIKENFSEYISLWLRLGLRHPLIYLEAFWIQNMAYFDPGYVLYRPMSYGCNEMEHFPIDTTPLLPRLNTPYVRFTQTPYFLPVPGSFLLSHSAFMVWMCMLCIIIQLTRKQYGIVMAGIFLLLFWGTNLLGPVALMRYMLGFFYCVPVLFARMFGSVIPSRRSTLSPTLADTP